MHADYDFDGAVVLVTGATGALGSAVAEYLADRGATVAAADVVPPDDEDALLDPVPGVSFYEGDFTDEAAVERVVGEVVDDHGRLDGLCNVAGTWRGGDHVEETDVGTFELLFDVNVRTAFLASKHALPPLQASEGAIVSVSARSSLEAGTGDAPYRASKAAVRLLTESVAEENLGTVRANSVMPSIIDTPTNRKMMPDADHESWVDPREIAGVVAFLLSDAAAPTSGAAVPVYGEA
jgi:NAD(P)-dependent dehydrogenase (short-subunit alcohol dehydrogenase family)